MAASFLLLPMLVLLGLMVGGVMLLVALLGNKQTRPFALLMLAVGGVMVGGVVLYATMARTRFEVQSVEHARVQEITHMLQAMHQQELSMAQRTLDEQDQQHRTTLVRQLADHQAQMKRVEQELAEVQGRAPAVAASYSGPVAVRASWGLILLAMLGLGVLYGVIKLVNSGSAAGLLGAGGVLALLMLAGLLLTRVSHQNVSTESSTATGDAWEQMTRPRIDLSQRAEQAAKADDQKPSRFAVVVNGQDIAFDLNTPIAPLVRRIEDSFRDNGKKLDLRAGAYSISYSGKIDAGKVSEVLHKFREQIVALVKAEKQEADSNSSDEDPADPPQPTKPAWVDAPPKRIGKVYREVVEVGPYATEKECYEKLGPALLEAAAEYARTQAGIDLRPDLLQQIGVTPGELMQQVCVDEYLQTYYSDSAGGDMNRLFVQVEFEQSFRERLLKANAAYQRGDAVKGITLLGALVMLLVGGVFGLLKLDTATRGYYTKRLFLGVPAAIIGLVVLGLLLTS